ncbi:LADA_0C01948g1_1 [Lachancea dasiensis]|uniref:LADA_0C01948g1_1 n=1 Tax=Lachancea dasiensis TaxID=1072105 RepID=A0A1G4IXQ0_9SACH|nr:LADA_0C01948g1_1 [Lachancea dasiensis]
MSLTLRVHLKRFQSSLSSQRPPFYTVFPTKKLVNRFLFDLDSKLTFAKLYPVYESIYESLAPNGTPAHVPSSFQADDIMIMKKVLERLRRRTKSINKNLIGLENELLDRAAEMGNNDAISSLAFDVLRNPARSAPEDVVHAKTLIKQLYKMGHPLTIKLTGDLAFDNNDLLNAEKYFNQFLEVEIDTIRAGEVYCKLGTISFKKPDLQEAERKFLESVRLAPLENVVLSYYHLAQLYMDSEPVKARSLMESAASEGFKESFQMLGFLEMNYFHEYQKALQWFKLGMELYDIECFIGYFDCSLKLNAPRRAKNCLDSMSKLSKTNESSAAVFQSFLNSRQAQITRLKSCLTDPFFKYSPEKHSGEITAVSEKNRWEL